ncbi:MAG: DoxX family membrane protein [Terracidiphilus sp.]
MKIVATIARYLMGLIFVVFGLNKFFNFIPSGPLPPGIAGQFMMAMVTTKYMMLVGTFEVVGALFLLANRFVPLALAFLAPVIVNILFVNATMAPQGIPATAVVTVCWLLVYFRVRSEFAPLFKPTKQE